MILFYYSRFPPFHLCYVAAGSISNVTVSDESITSIGITLNWTMINLTNSDLIHYTVFSLPIRGPYDPIMTSNRRKRRQSAQTGELTMNFTGTTGTLTNLYGAVTYRIQVAAVSTFNGQNVTGDRSPPIEMMTLEGGEQLFTTTHILSVIYFSAYCSPKPELYEFYQHWCYV